MYPPNFTALLADIRAEQYDQDEIARIEALLATEEQVLANALRCEDMLARRHAKADQRRFDAEPVCITGFSPFHDEEPEMTADEIAADNHQDDLRWAAKEQD